MSNTSGQLVSLNVARVQPLKVGPRSVMSGIGKRPVSGRVDVHSLGLDGDEQADPSVHGGLVPVNRHLFRFGQLNQHWVFNTAGHAPRRPDIEQPDLATQVCCGDCFVWLAEHR